MMISLRRGFFCVALVLVVGFVCAGQGLAETYYVSTTGDNEADGLTEATAFRSICIAGVHAYAGDTVMVKGGNYSGENIYPHSGTADNPLVFKGYDGRPVISSSGNAFHISGRSYIDIEGFDFNGCDKAVYVQGWSPGGSSHINLRNLRSFGDGGAIYMCDGTDHCRVESCYIEDSYRNSICFHGDPLWYDPCEFNIVTNCAVVRGGHSSIDIHTACPDTYVVGNLIRERGWDREANAVAAAGMYLHNHSIDRIRVVGNSVTNVHWGLELAGADYGVIAENLIYNCSKVDIDSTYFPEESPILNHCTNNTLKDNVIFDASVSSMRLCGAEDTRMLRNQIESAHSYDSCQYNGVDPTGNSVIDPMRGIARVIVSTGGTCSLSFSEGVWPTGTVFRLTGGDTVEKTMGPGGVDFGVFTAGTYTVRSTLPGDLPAPQHVRVMPLAKAAGGAVVVWTEGCNSESGFVIERKLEGESNFSYLDEVWIGVTHYVDESVGRSKAAYRVRTVQGAESSACSDTDEIVRYGYWLTNRTGLAMGGVSDESAAFGEVENGVLRTLVVEQVTSVERQAGAVEGVSSAALLESVGGDFPDSFGDMGEAEVWLVSSETVTATLRWRDGWIRGNIDDCSGEYTLSLHVDYWDDGSVMFNYEAIDATYDAGTGLISMTLTDSGELAIELVPEPATMVLLGIGGIGVLVRRRRKA